MTLGQTVSGLTQRTESLDLYLADILTSSFMVRIREKNSLLSEHQQNLSPGIVGIFQMDPSRAGDGAGEHSPLLCSTQDFLEQELPFVRPAKPYRMWGRSAGQQGESVESLMRTVDVCRSVGLEIINRTTTVTLRDFRSYCFSGKILTPLPFEIGPGSKGICAFAKTPYSLRGSVGTVICKSDTFFLAITFSNPFDYILYEIEFALEIFTEENHLGNLSDVFSKMMKSKPYHGSSLFQRAELGCEHETLEVSKGNIRVQAKMSNNQKAILKVQVEDMSPPPYHRDM